MQTELQCHPWCGQIHQCSCQLVLAAVLCLCRVILPTEFHTLCLSTPTSFSFSGFRLSTGSFRFQDVKQIRPSVQTWRGLLLQYASLTKEMNEWNPRLSPSTCGRHCPDPRCGSRNMWDYQQVAGHNANRAFVIQTLFCQVDVSSTSFTVFFLSGTIVSPP